MTALRRRLHGPDKKRPRSQIKNIFKVEYVSWHRTKVIHEASNYLTRDDIAADFLQLREIVDPAHDNM